MYQNQINITSDRPARLAPVLLQVLNDRLRDERPGPMTVNGQRIEVLGGLFRFVPSWNLFTAISYGTIEIVNDEDGLAIHYAMSFTQLYIIVVAIGLLIAVGGAAHGESPRSTITFAALGCLWLGGMNVVIAKARFAKLMRRCIQEACSELGEQNNK